MNRWDKPLAPRLRKAYHEYMALIVLKEIFSDTYGELKRVDKPDLQDNQKKIGVEVTRALEGNYGEIDGLLTEAFYCKGQAQQEATNRISKLGGRFSDDEFRVFSWPTGHDNFKVIYYEFEKKLKKLNDKGYLQLDHNELFVHSDILADNLMLEQALHEMIKKQSNYKEEFEKVYVYVPGALYKLDFYKRNYCNMKLEPVLQSEWAIAARERAESNG